ncbi:MAG: gamma-glutamylcyclotransferase [Candidatus Levybacteria bacterium]|nr:gamma-glutamylcyclotransferase [Candidatus Levybacteria bacterium]
MPHTKMNTAFIYYFGYGANADPAMMEAITGRSDLKGKPAVLMDHRLEIQRLDQIPTNPRRILEEAWGPDFRTYVAIPERGPRINGIIWKIDEEARKFIRNWELVEGEVGPELAWRKEAHLSSVVLQSGGSSVYGVQTEVLGDGQTFDQSLMVDGTTDYPLFLMPRETVLRAAILERETYLARIGMEGRPPTKER